ncbi:tripartite tricarboxylate transporter substrate binding protein [Belnapia sp. T6]|uniref:Tripartite tricarboxylate transporter substrate binding protein n=1 Tax=Belnapia mucosa TaxID=2804532 RepID=A0ABS1VA70_9PROT|nr:tripartite tricarboxylate transporter substrate binding protein [Belnapia mucosa]MBL6458242.1 tripartite tricarboxylate transporter substrate binding protein [Belnapia mucosa]
MTMRRRTLLGLATTVLAHPAVAAAYPDRPVRLVVPFAPGGGTDLMARAVAQAMSGMLGQQIIIDNRSGGNGTIGTQHVAQAKPDGYTGLIATGSELSLKPLLEANLPYDVDRDFAPAVLLGITPVVIAVHPSLPVTNIQGLIAFAKAQPRGIDVANPGNGGAMHVAVALLALRAGITVQHVPYRGAGPAVADTVAGNVKIVASGLPPVLAQARQGRLRMIAVTTPRRTPAAPEVPTLEEAGIAGFDMSNAVGLVVPRGTPAEAVERLNAAANAAVREAEVRRVFLENGVEPLGSTVEEYGTYVRAEREHYREWIRLTGIVMD